MITDSYFLLSLKQYIMKKLFLNSIQEVENLKTLLHSNQISYRYLKMKGQYLFNYPSELQERVIELGY